MDAGFEPIFEQQTEQTEQQANAHGPAGYGCENTSSELRKHRNDATVAMVLGILGDVFFLPPIMNIAGLTLSILALVRANTNRRYANAQDLTEDGRNIAGRWCGIVGIILNALSILFWLAVIVIAVFTAAVILGSVGTEVAKELPSIMNMF